jgi:hypothetical protein
MPFDAESIRGTRGASRPEGSPLFGRGQQWMDDVHVEPRAGPHEFHDRADPSVGMVIGNPEARALNPGCASSA